MNEKLKYRQGDVLIFEVDNLPPVIEHEMKAKQEVVLAEGEVTGHRHLLVADPETKVEIAHDGVGFYLKVSGGKATIRHEEHKPITLAPGNWRIKIQQEYDPLRYRRNVID
jgi:hypothetical protein